MFIIIHGNVSLCYIPRTTHRKLANHPSKVLNTSFSNPSHILLRTLRSSVMKFAVVLCVVWLFRTLLATPLKLAAPKQNCLEYQPCGEDKLTTALSATTMVKRCGRVCVKLCRSNDAQCRFQCRSKSCVQFQGFHKVTVTHYFPKYCAKITCSKKLLPAIPPTIVKYSKGREVRRSSITLMKPPKYRLQ